MNGFPLCRGREDSSDVYKVRLILRPSATTQIFEMYGPGKDGKETKMMEMTYTKNQGRGSRT